MAATLETPAGPAASGAREPELIIFNYSGTDPLGTRVKYYLFAEDDEQARGSLEESGLTDVEVWARREDLMTRLGRKKKVSRTDIGSSPSSCAADEGQPARPLRRRRDG